MERVKNLAHLFIEVEISPFFTAAWDHSIVNKILLISSLFLALFNLSYTCYSDTIQKFLLFNHGGKFYLKTNDISYFSQPFIITSNVVINKTIPLVLVERTDELPREIYGRKFEYGFLYRFFSLNSIWKIF